MLSSNDFLVVGIGASAGGVNACRSFFEQVPADSGMAFVTILHLSPEYDSHLSEVLQRSSKIPAMITVKAAFVSPSTSFLTCRFSNAYWRDDRKMVTLTRFATVISAACS